jgi:hypothetical protein
MDVVVSMPAHVARQCGDIPPVTLFVTPAIGCPVIEDAVIERYRAGRVTSVPRIPRVPRSEAKRLGSRCLGISEATKISGRSFELLARRAFA